MRIAREQPSSNVGKSRENPALSDFHGFLFGYFLENVILRQPLLQQYHFSESSENTSVPP